MSFPYSTKDGTPLPVVKNDEGEFEVLPPAREPLPSPTATTELPPPPAAPQEEGFEFKAWITKSELERIPLVLYCGGFTEAVLRACPGAEVRARWRSGGYVLSANLYAEGGDRMHDSHKVHPFELTRLQFVQMALDRGRLRGEAAADTLLAALARKKKDP